MSKDDHKYPSMDLTGYIERVNFHFDRLGVTTRPSPDAYLQAWQNQIPARKMAETYKRRLGRRPTSEHGE